MEPLFGNPDWLMSLGDRLALEGLLVSLRPATSIEIGTSRGGSLARISLHSDVVHAFDLGFKPEVAAKRYPNVVFHKGDSHVLLPQVLGELVVAARPVDFVLIDGDHSAEGARRDVEDVLGSPAVSRTVILIHDIVNERVRAGVEAVDFSAFPDVRHVDFDLLSGHMWRDESLDGRLWGGFGLVLTGWDPPEVTRVRPAAYSNSEVFDGFLRTRAVGVLDGRPKYEEIAALEQEVAFLKRYVQMMQGSLSWKVTAPLRKARGLLRVPHRARRR